MNQFKIIKIRCNQMTCFRCKYEFCWLCRKGSSYQHFKTYNIFGCPGMLFQEVSQNKICAIKCKIILGFILLTLLILPILPLVLLYIIFCFPVLIYFENKPCYCRMSDVCKIILLFLMGIPLAPISIIILLFIGIWIVLNFINRAISRNRNRRQRNLFLLN